MTGGRLLMVYTHVCVALFIVDYAAKILCSAHAYSTSKIIFVVTSIAFC